MRTIAIQRERERERQSIHLGKPVKVSESKEYISHQMKD